jgi:hypothetical protein
VPLNVCPYCKLPGLCSVDALDWWNAIRLSDGVVCVVQKNFFDIKTEGIFSLVRDASHLILLEVTDTPKYKFAKPVDDEGYVAILPC